MEKSEVFKLTALGNLAELVGDFIRYWGFRKIHGEIWTIVYLSRKPVSGSELVEILEVSKALVSPALKELEDEGLIFQTDSENSKTKRYRAAEDVFQVIRSVLERREKPLLAKIVNAQSRLGEEVENADSATSKFVDKGRFLKIRKMTEVAQMSLSMIADVEFNGDIDRF